MPEPSAHFIVALEFPDFNALLTSRTIREASLVRGEYPPYASISVAVRSIVVIVRSPLPSVCSGFDVDRIPCITQIVNTNLANNSFNNPIDNLMIV